MMPGAGVGWGGGVLGQGSAFPIPRVPIPLLTQKQDTAPELGHQQEGALWR